MKAENDNGHSTSLRSSQGNHTPGPWRQTGHDIERANGQSVATVLRDSWQTKEEQVANARRIVACVNACDGINTPTLEAEGSKFALQRWAEVSKEREELIEALSVIAGEPRQDDTYVGMDSKQIARAVLSKLAAKP